MPDAKPLRNVSRLLALCSVMRSQDTGRLHRTICVRGNFPGGRPTLRNDDLTLQLARVAYASAESL